MFFWWWGFWSAPAAPLASGLVTATITLTQPEAEITLTQPDAEITVNS